MIKVKGLVKEFNGFKALKGLNMHVKAGEVYGFIGPNGSGKTTTMNILTGLSSPSQGECIVNGLKITNPGRIGYLPEDPKFYPWMTAYETLEYLSGRRNIDKILKWTGLYDEKNRRVGGFSRGMKQRLGIGAALIRNPQLLILDEPSSALDPEGRSEVLRMITDLKGMGKTILFSSHILDDVERVCDTVGMINAGQMIFEKPLAQLQKENMQPVFDITAVRSIEIHVLDALKRINGVEILTASEKSLTVKLADNMVSVSVMKLLADHKIEVESFARQKARLETLFLQGVNTK